MRYMLLLLLLLTLGTSTMAEDSRALVIKPTRPALKTGMNYSGHHALLVGVSDYDKLGGWSDLESIPSELDALQAVLTESGFQVTRVNNPDGKALEAAFEDFIDAYGYDKDNRLFFFYAGHGHSMKSGSKSRGFLVPADAPSPLASERDFLRKCLQMNQILAWSCQMTAKHALFLFDSCFSGTVFSSRAFPKEPPHITKLTAEPVRQYLTSGSAGETVPATSTFAKFVVRGLQGAADRNNDKYILGTELGLYIKEKLAYYQAGTTPQIGKIRDADLDRGEFVIRVPQKLNQPISVPKQEDQLEKMRQAFEQKQKKIKDLLVLSYQAANLYDRDKANAYVDQVLALAPGHPEALKLKASLAMVVPKVNKPPVAKPVIVPEPVTEPTPKPASIKLPTKIGESYTNSIGMKLMYIPAGEFMMGSPESEKGRFSDEKQHLVLLTKAFYMTSTEVTQGQWLKVMGNNPSHFKGDKLPVEKVSWDDAVAFCKKLSQMEGKTYTLPTEAEWEYACRAETTGAWAGGEEICWFEYNAGGKTHPVGTKKANAWGLHDMHGNVSEWCSDTYGDYPERSATDPNGSDSGPSRVQRGGSWYDLARNCRSALRNADNPAAKNGGVGFRVIHTVHRRAQAAPSMPSLTKPASSRKREQHGWVELN